MALVQDQETSASKPYHITFTQEEINCEICISVLALSEEAFANRISPKVQRKIIRILEGAIQDMRNGEFFRKTQDSIEDLILLNNLQGQAGPPENVIPEFMENVLFRLCVFFRHSKPSRIYEAVAPLTYMIECQNRIGIPHSAPRLRLYLAVALSRTSGEEERAISMFQEALDCVAAWGDRLEASKDVLWTRANMARLFRQMGRIAEAEEQEDIARKWIVEVYDRPPFTADQIRACVSDDVGTGDHILDHPDVVEVFNEGWHELGDFTKIAPNGKDAIVLSKGLDDLGGLNVSELPPGCSVLYPALGLCFTESI